MPVAPTYPGVYIEEIPSGVHTITGVSTSITAFVGYTARGLVSTPVHIFSFADFERAFGGLDGASPLSYAVNHFFQNGGNEAYIVRVAHGAVAAQVTLKNSNSAGIDVITLTAAGAGTWGNNIQVDVDYDTANPKSLFNLKVTSFVMQNGSLVIGATEMYRNLSMNRFDPGYAVDAINSGSDIVTAEITANAIIALTGGITPGFSESAQLTLADLAKVDATHNRIAFTLNGQGPFETTIALPVVGSLAAKLNAMYPNMASQMAIVAGAAVNGSLNGNALVMTSGDPSERSSVHFFDASMNSATSALKLGLAAGGTEVDGEAFYRPFQSGTVAGVMNLAGISDPATLVVNVQRGSPLATVDTVTLPLWGGASPLAAPTTPDEALSRVRTALSGAADPMLTGATVSIVDGVLRVVPGNADPNLVFTFANGGGGDTAADSLGLTTAGSVELNVGHYGLGVGIAVLAQLMGGPPGNNGTVPSATEIVGDQAAKTGMYALETVDLFNLLTMPDLLLAKPSESGDVAAISAAIAYCTRRRAFVIVDSPAWLTAFADAQTWINGSNAASLRSRNAALYFPRLRASDPLMNGMVRGFPAAGALAGLFARTDGDRGVWKAPAGTSANIVGATGLTVTLTDDENGTLNPLALNCLRTFPVYGTVSWGARTARGADALADDYKYVPVRRLALFLEESLFRGTQWAVFEPNDEPLWAQIRLNLGAFMHTLFAQGAFQGRTPREAYFVKCDSETTTQNDIDLGRVNIIVGFAPLKPAEFVIIQIQQIAGAIQT